MTQHSVGGTAPSEAVHKPGRNEPPADRSGSSYVLVVDDEAVVRDFLTRRLEGWGYVVKQAESAAEALEMMVTEPASVVLCGTRFRGA